MPAIAIPVRKPPAPMNPPPTIARRFVRHGLYPVLAASTLLYLAHALSQPVAEMTRYYPAYLVVVIGVMLVAEVTVPLRREWRMRPRLFWRRDVPYLAMGASTLGLVNWWAAQVATRHALLPGQGLPSAVTKAITGLPLVVGVLASLLLTDLLWYGVHRASHAARGSLGGFLWRVHAAHHLPQQVYVLMHPIGHPINAVIVRALLALPPFWLGLPPRVAFAASVVTGFQGLVSHWNVDSRVGWLNRVLVGTELHRHHHSADPAELGNHGAVLSVWDQLFGTWVYRPGQLPRAFGLDEPAHYPADTELLKVLALPFRRRA